MKVFRYTQYCGRMGELDGIFALNDDEVEWMNKWLDYYDGEIYFGEVLGKHSAIIGYFEYFEELYVSDEVTEFVREYGPFGFNPFHYMYELPEDYED